MTARKQNATSPPAADGSGWGPRLAQEARLRQLEKMLVHRRSDADAADTEIERAVLLGALDRRQEAQQAFIELLGSEHELDEKRQKRAQAAPSAARNRQGAFIDLPG